MPPFAPGFNPVEDPRGMKQPKDFALAEGPTGAPSFALFCEGWDATIATGRLFRAVDDD
jgi:hypothetical protein